MRKKIIILTAVVIIGSLSFAVFGSSSTFITGIISSIKESPVSQMLFNTEKTGAVSKTTSTKSLKIDQAAKAQKTNSTEMTTDDPPPEVPDEVVYLFFFREVANFEDKASKADLQGNDGSLYRTVYQRVTNLTSTQNEFLRNTAIDCMSAVKLKDDAAEIISNQVGEDFQAQLDAAGTGIQTLPTPQKSRALSDLQTERTQIILQHRDALQNYFGPDFEGLESFIKSHITSNITIAPENSPSKPDSQSNASNGKPVQLHSQNKVNQEGK